MKLPEIAVVGCGWLGLPLAKHFVSQSFNVHGTTQQEEKLAVLQSFGIQPHRLIQDDFFHPQTWLKTCNYLVLNIPPSSFQEKYAEAMVTVVKNLSSDAKVIFVSSTSVYADQNETVTEATPLTGSNRGGVYVQAAEELLKDELGERLTIVRMAGLVGGNRHPVKYMSGKTYPGAEAPINLIHLADCIGIIDAILAQHQWGTVFNACAPDHPSKSAYYLTAAEQLGVAPPIFTSTEVPYKRVSSKKLINELNYRFKYDSPFKFPLAD